MASRRYNYFLISSLGARHIVLLYYISLLFAVAKLQFNLISDSQLWLQ
jgi:hypothetical protein